MFPIWLLHGNKWKVAAVEEGLLEFVFFSFPLGKGQEDSFPARAGVRDDGLVSTRPLVYFWRSHSERSNTWLLISLRTHTFLRSWMTGKVFPLRAFNYRFCSMFRLMARRGFNKFLSDGLTENKRPSELFATHFASLFYKLHYGWTLYKPPIFLPAPLHCPGIRMSFSIKWNHFDLKCHLGSLNCSFIEKGMLY